MVAKQVNSINVNYVRHNKSHHLALGLKYGNIEGTASTEISRGSCAEKHLDSKCLLHTQNESKSTNFNSCTFRVVMFVIHWRFVGCNLGNLADDIQREV